jgi:ABC-type Fe3+/spermidine/putrescine transport system ATPase subunit
LVALCNHPRFTPLGKCRANLLDVSREPLLADSHTDGAFVEFDRVQKSYDGENLVVKDLNLSMPKGEFLTMLGPSGSGKTTCLMMLAGFETATHGDIRLDGQPWHRHGFPKLRFVPAYDRC